MAKKLIGTDGGGGIRGTGMSGGRGGKTGQTLNTGGGGTKPKMVTQVTPKPKTVVNVTPKPKTVVNVKPKPKVNGGTMYSNPKKPAVTYTGGPTRVNYSPPGKPNK
jgi:hypothetical protein